MNEHKFTPCGFRPLDGESISKRVMGKLSYEKLSFVSVPLSLNEFLNVISMSLDDVDFLGFRPLDGESISKLSDIANAVKVARLIKVSVP